MRLFTPIFTFIVITILFGINLNKTNTINQLENQLKYQKSQTDSLIYKIDSLYHVIDTLILEAEIWDYNIKNNTTHLLSAIIQVDAILLIMPLKTQLVVYKYDKLWLTTLTVY